MGLWAAAAGARGHQDDAGEHGRRLEEQFIARHAAGRFNPLKYRIERDLLQHESSIPPLSIKMVRVPLPEVIIRPLVRRVIEIVSPWINRQLVEQIGIEPGGIEQTAIGRSQQIECQDHKLPIAANRSTRPRDIERDRPNALVCIGSIFCDECSTATGRWPMKSFSRATAPAVIRSVSSHGGPSASTASATRPIKNGRSKSSSAR